jgi:tetratricopeptide (TPR) repeat protein
LAATLGRFEEAVVLGRCWVQLDPLSVPAHSNLGFLAGRAGRLDEAEAAYRKVLELDPQYPTAHRLIGQLHLQRSKPEAAIEEMERETDSLWRHHGLALAYHALGRKQEADAALAELVLNHKDAAAFQIAQVYGYRGEVDEAFAWLERAYAQRDSGLLQVKGDPFLERLEADVRYEAFLAKMRLPLEQGDENAGKPRE